jgi:hypothetical protein
MVSRILLGKAFDSIRALAARISWDLVVVSYLRYAFEVR